MPVIAAIALVPRPQTHESSAVPATPADLPQPVVSGTRSDSVDQDRTTLLNQIAIATRAIGIARGESSDDIRCALPTWGRTSARVRPISWGTLLDNERSAIGRRYFRPASAMRGKFSDHLADRWNGGSSGSMPKVRVCGRSDRGEGAIYLFRHVDLIYTDVRAPKR